MHDQTTKFSVTQVARNQFNCQSLEGVMLENQPTNEFDCFGSHFDEVRYCNKNLSNAIFLVTMLVNSTHIILLCRGIIIPKLWAHISLKKLIFSPHLASRFFKIVAGIGQIIVWRSFLHLGMEPAVGLFKMIALLMERFRGECERSEQLDVLHWLLIVDRRISGLGFFYCSSFLIHHLYHHHLPFHVFHAHKSYSKGFFCNTIYDGGRPQYLCDPSATHKAICDLTKDSMPPSSHQYFPDPVSRTMGCAFIFKFGFSW